MKVTITRTALLAVVGLSVSGFAATAAPTTASGLSGFVDNPIVEVQVSRMERRRMMRQNRAMRRSNRSRPSQAGNARDPKRPVRAQSQGGTTGGPRF